MNVVPARAGMSPTRFCYTRGQGRGPRASGDEPDRLAPGGAGIGWSPRERG